MTAVFLFISLTFTVLLFYAVDQQNRTIFSLMKTQVTRSVVGRYIAVTSPWCDRHIAVTPPLQVALHEIRIEEQQERIEQLHVEKAPTTPAPEP